MDTKQLKDSIIKDLDASRERLTELSLKIHANPELGFLEVKASDWLSTYLEEEGFSTERGICGLETAFRATYGSGKPAIGLLAEYDALAGLGHGCGHNLICAASVGAGVALKLAADRLGGTVQVIGTPAEEGGGGKVIMAERGAFNDLDAAMLVHPESHNVATINALACQTLDIEFFGKAAHAAAAPEQGVNALEALLLSYAGINSLRQHIRGNARIHGYIVDGGKASNVVPDHSAGSFIVRAMENSYLDDLKERVLNCFRAGATATGARLEYRWGERYDSMRNNMVLADLFLKNMESIGRHMPMGPNPGGVGSTDVGNVSQVVPTIQPEVAIAPRGTSIHSTDFAAAAASGQGMDGMLDAAKAMALTATDLLADPEALARVEEEFMQFAPAHHRQGE